jgi:glutathione synthase
MKLLFLMNPLEQVKPEKDTSFAFMLGAQRRGHSVYYLPQGGISLRDEQVLFDVVPVEARCKPEEPPFRRHAPVRLGLELVDAVFIRTDPPFDERYLIDTWLLDRAAGRCPMINEPGGLRSANEKLWATRFAGLVPPTLVSARRDLFDAFLEEHGEIVAKPTNAFGGAGVFRLRRGDSNTGVIWETLTRFGRAELVAQRFLPEAEHGDKRILLLDGEPLGAVLRVHSPADHRNNFFAGGSAQTTEVTREDRAIIEALRPELRRLGLHFVGIDVIGGKLIEVNVTSPTCLQEINALRGEHLEELVIEYVEQLVRIRG